MKTIENISKFIQECIDHQIKNPWHPTQVDIENSKYDREFTKYLCSIADVIFLEELSGIKREPTNLSQEDIIEKISESSSLKSGIKINFTPQMKVMDWELWDGGYIEGFVRTHIKNEPDYFIWTYIKMDYLNDILTKFQDKLVYYI